MFKNGTLINENSYSFYAWKKGCRKDERNGEKWKINLFDTFLLCMHFSDKDSRTQWKSFTFDYWGVDWSTDIIQFEVLIDLPT